MSNESQRLFWGSQASPVLWANVEAGEYRLAFGGQSTAALQATDGAATVQAALEALSTIGVGNVLVAATADGWAFEFVGDLADADVGLISFAADVGVMKQRADAIACAVVQAGIADVEVSGLMVGGSTPAVAPVSEVQVVNLGGAASGTFDLTYGAASASVDVTNGYAVAAACDALFGSGNTNVAANGMGGYTVTFQGALANTPLDQMSVANNATDGSPYTSTTVEGVAGVHQVDVVTFNNWPAVAGSWLFEGNAIAYNATPSLSGADVTGSAVSGSVVVTYQDYSSHGPVNASLGTPVTLLYVAGRPHVWTLTLNDAPSEGEFFIFLNGVSQGMSFSYPFGQVVTAGAVTGYDATGGNPSWQFSSQQNTASPGTFEAFDTVTAPLRKTLWAEVVVVADGVPDPPDGDPPAGGSPHNAGAYRPDVGFGLGLGGS